MDQFIKFIYTLFIKVENGTTKSGRASYRTIKVPYIRADVTREEIIAAIDVLRPAMATRIVSVELVRDKVTTVWAPEMRKEKLEEEGEFSGQEQKQTAQASVTSAQSGVSVTPAASIQTSTVQTAPAILGEEARKIDFRKEVNVMPDQVEAKEGAAPYNPNILVSHDGKNQIDMTAFLAANPQVRLAPPKTTAEVGYVAPLSYADIPGYAEQTSGVGF